MKHITLKFGTFEQYQAQAPETIPLPPNYCEDDGETAVYWLSASGVLVNSHGLNIMIDLSRNFEHHVKSSEAMVFWASIQRMLRCLAPPRLYERPYTRKTVTSSQR